jgi:DNA mismatch repair protein MLH1
LRSLAPNKLLLLRSLARRRPPSLALARSQQATSLALARAPTTSFSSARSQPTTSSSRARSRQQPPSLALARRNNDLLLFARPPTPLPHSPPSQIDYGDERLCFEGICAELGQFYAELPYVKADGSSQSSQESSASDASSKAPTKGAEVLNVPDATSHWVQHNLVPALAYLLVPPKEFSEDGITVQRMALLSSLYKVFERC